MQIVAGSRDQQRTITRTNAYSDSVDALRPDLVTVDEALLQIVESAGTFRAYKKTLVFPVVRHQFFTYRSRIGSHTRKHAIRVVSVDAVIRAGH